MTLAPVSSLNSTVLLLRLTELLQELDPLNNVPRKAAPSSSNSHPAVEASVVSDRQWALKWHLFFTVMADTIPSWAFSFPWCFLLVHFKGVVQPCGLGKALTFPQRGRIAVCHGVTSSTRCSFADVDSCCDYLTVSFWRTAVFAFSKVRSHSSCSFSDILLSRMPTTMQSRSISSLIVPYSHVLISSYSASRLLSCPLVDF